MIYTTRELLELGESEYSIRCKVKSKSLFLIERGVYSDKQNQLFDEVMLCTKYRDVIITGLSAFAIYGLTTQIPEYHYVASKQHSFPIRRREVVQSYQDCSFFSIGVTTMNYHHGAIKIYNLERLLIETIRLKEKMPPELYYEVISSFRKIKDTLSFVIINEYCQYFKNGSSIINKIKEII